ncbi:MAG: hypothetical protein Tsb0019_34230 [Roseibium sp.]
MSFRDPFGPLRADAGPDLIPDDPPLLRDIGLEGDVPDLRLAHRRRFRGARDAIVFAALVAGATLLLFIPIVLVELASVETVGVQGHILTAAEFAARLRNLFLGTFVMALALISLFASAALASRRLVVRPRLAAEAEEAGSLAKMVPLSLGKVRNV